jgi:hypothetical protein
MIRVHRCISPARQQSLFTDRLRRQPDYSRWKEIFGCCRASTQQDGRYRSTIPSPPTQRVHRTIAPPSPRADQGRLALQLAAGVQTYLEEAMKRRSSLRLCE